MAENLPESNLCSICAGTGLDDGNFCLSCSGSGYVSSQGVGIYRRDLHDKVDGLGLATNVFKSYVVLECLDPTEYAALTAAQKTSVLVVLACGQVDLNAGKAGIVRLTAAFGAESTTVASLTALLG
jgi:hypothetical protein